MTIKSGLLSLALVWAWSAGAAAQSSSLLRVPDGSARRPIAQAGAAEVAPQEGFAALPPKPPIRSATRAIEQMSVFAVPMVPPRKFKVHDLVTIIVRQQKKYEADGKLDAKKKWDLTGKLDDWFRMHPRNRLGQDQLTAGKPGFDFTYQNQLRSDAENERRDSFITRIQASIVDVKPNGNLVLEATLTEEHDEEKFTLTLTGTARGEDVTPDNTLLSTQIAEMTLLEKNEGAVRDSTRRGWIPKVLDWARPF